MFPIPLPSQWLRCADQLHLIQDQAVTSWIRSESSLTVKIKELGMAFSVEVLSQTKQALSARLKTKLGCDDEYALFREVLLKQGDVPLVYAQTIMPDSTITGAEKMLATLGNQSLGQVLFQSPQAKRSEIEFSRVEPQGELAQFIQQLGQRANKPSYIRRSVFTLNNKPLLVCECFLPELFR